MTKKFIHKIPSSRGNRHTKPREHHKHKDSASMRHKKTFVDKKVDKRANHKSFKQNKIESYGKSHHNSGKDRGLLIRKTISKRNDQKRVAQRKTKDKRSNHPKK